MNKIKLTILLFLLVIVSVFSQEKKYLTHQVKKGETVFSITQKYSISKADFLKLNPDIKNDEVSIDQVVIVPNKAFKAIPDIEDGDYVLDGFLYHKVLPKENYFRLRKEYGASKRILRKHNEILRIDDLKAGQVIKIPVKDGYEVDAVKVKKEDKTVRPYLVKAKETKYMISRRYGISVEELEKMNPQIKEGLKAETIIKVPNRKEIPDAVNDGSITHQIEKKETLFSLSQKFKISQEQILLNNPELKDGVKEGMIIRIPKVLTLNNNQIFIENISLNNNLKVAIMLPFTTGKSELDFDTDRTLNIATDFYLGVEMALDSLKKQGLNIAAKVFDTKNKITEVSTIIKTNQFNDVDAIIGPMFLNNVKLVSQSLGNQNTAIISPVSSKDHGVFASKNTIQDTPSEDELSQKVLDYIKENYKDENLIVIKDDIEENQLKYNKTIAELKRIDSLGKLSVLSPVKGYIRPDFFKKNIQDKEQNWVVLLTDDPSVTNDVIQNLGVMPEKINITLFALHHNVNPGGNFEKAENHHLARVNLHYATENFVDENDVKVQQFVKKYKAKNHLEPSEYAFKGFDITYDALARMATYKMVNSAFSGGISERTSSKFFYVKNGNKGFINKGIFLVKYDGLNLVNVEKEPTDKMELKE
ncbi:LysM peptidoglycan-binding domain-containing protein [Aureibaculum sp. 2210JD6-5]|uniref:LysM peptidoglycan-binding domain-containing protein n=1 Tax=Aureibaculum sp. 2210JD6-5 TaxID=3103957 RepID=UPI002AAE72E6|nr:LysM peptidoglycan-binding domain-containing protein [Aureibaculum sp. 2210JD6-5]MDY7394340.1 LysM peptidoglycan-binding domain-containing protein [Aureibaculum sp. 2210JD6-5]